MRLTNEEKTAILVAVFSEECIVKLKKLLSYFSIFEWCLWIGSVIAVTLSFLCSGEFYFLTLVASLVGVSSLIFIAKGNVVGQFLIIVFSLLYGTISIRFRYWGEMITYMFMSLPAAVSACITWLKNPSKESKSEVMIASMTAKKCLFSVLFALTVAVIFHFLLRWLQTANLWLSTLSIATSFLAASFLFLRSRYYALVYAANDVVLIGLWTFASIHSLSYLPMVVCFLAFLCNDMYGFINWKRMQDRQRRQNEQ